MKLMIQWQIPIDKRADVMAGFAAMDLADYQSQQGSTIKVIGRWHDLVNCTGIAICETDDVQALGVWLMKWNPACEFQMVPVLDDAEAHATAKKGVA